MIVASIILAQVLTAAATTNVTLVSDVKTENAWARKVVMKTGSGEIINDDNQVGDAAEVAADREAAERAGEISSAAQEAMETEIARLDAASASAATNAVAIALAIPPETSRTNLTGFVVQESSTGTVDTQWVWYNRSLALKPNRYVVYQGIDNCSTVKVEWVSWSAEGEDVTVGGRTWSGCHQCTVQRPSWAVGVTCLTNPNERWGGPKGMAFGDMVLTRDGAALFTGVLTNKTDASEIIYFNNGFFMGYVE